MTLSEILTKLEELEAKATPGEWEIMPCLDDDDELFGHVRAIGPITSCDGCPIGETKDAELIAYSRNHLKEIVEALREAHEVLDWHRDCKYGSCLGDEESVKKARDWLKKWGDKE